MGHREYPSSHYDMDIHVNDLTITSRIGEKVLDGASVVVPQGTHAIIKGPSGAGKTFLATAMCDIRARKSDLKYTGDVSYHMRNKYDSDDTFVLPAKYPVKRRNISFVSQRPFFDSENTVEQEVLLDTGMKNIAVDMGRLYAVYEILGISDLIHRKMIDLSGGQQQRVPIAAALVTNPNVLITDEVTANLDLDAKTKTHQALGELSREFGMTVVSITHDDLTAPREIRMSDRRIVADSHPIINSQS